MQEAFLDAFRRLDNYSGEGSFGSWLKRIVVNRSLDYLRKARETVELKAAEHDLPDTGEEYQEEDLQLRVAEVKNAIAQLPEDYRVIITLFLIEGYDHEEISGILNITNQLSRTRYSRARQKLLGMLKNKNYQRTFSAN
jgi:RNA polymerase sigma-70 factor (ECF subfamily)